MNSCIVNTRGGYTCTKIKVCLVFPQIIMVRYMRSGFDKKLGQFCEKTPLNHGCFWGHFYYIGSKNESRQKNLQKSLKIPKNILRTMVKTSAQTDE